MEARVLRSVAKGPGVWATASDLWGPKERCSIGQSFVCLRAKGEAAMLRAYHFENWEEPIDICRSNLQTWRDNTTKVDRDFQWNSWYARSFPKTLWDNKYRLEQRGISRDFIKRSFGDRSEREDFEKMFKSRFQAKAYSLIIPGYLGHWGQRIEAKLKRWELGWCHRNMFSDSVAHNLGRLSKLVAPRVAAATWSTIWNRWCTARRFQSSKHCLLGCGHGADSIEHYMGCRFGRQVGAELLGVDGDYEDRKKAMLMVKWLPCDATCAGWAVLDYALYTTTIHLRSKGRTASTESEARELLKGAVLRAVEGHPRCRRLLSERWVTQRGSSEAHPGPGRR